MSIRKARPVRHPVKNSKYDFVSQHSDNDTIDAVDGRQCHRSLAEELRDRCGADNTSDYDSYINNANNGRYYGNGTTATNNATTPNTKKKGLKALVRLKSPFSSGGGDDGDGENVGGSSRHSRERSGRGSKSSERGGGTNKKSSERAGRSNGKSTERGGRSSGKHSGKSAERGGRISGKSTERGGRQVKSRERSGRSGSGRRGGPAASSAVQATTFYDESGVISPPITPRAGLLSAPQSNSKQQYDFSSNGISNDDSKNVGNDELSDVNVKTTSKSPATENSSPSKPVNNVNLTTPKIKNMQSSEVNLSPEQQMKRTSRTKQSEKPIAPIQPPPTQQSSRQKRISAQHDGKVKNESNESNDSRENAHRLPHPHLPHPNLPHPHIPHPHLPHISHQTYHNPIQGIYYSSGTGRGIVDEYVDYDDELSRELRRAALQDKYDYEDKMMKKREFRERHCGRGESDLYYRQYHGEVGDYQHRISPIKKRNNSPLKKVERLSKVEEEAAAAAALATAVHSITTGEGNYVATGKSTTSKSKSPSPKISAIKKLPKYSGNRSFSMNSSFSSSSPGTPETATRDQQDQSTISNFSPMTPNTEVNSSVSTPNDTLNSTSVHNITPSSQDMPPNDTSTTSSSLNMSSVQKNQEKDDNGQQRNQRNSQQNGPQSSLQSSLQSNTPKKLHQQVQNPFRKKLPANKSPPRPPTSASKQHQQLPHKQQQQRFPVLESSTTQSTSQSTVSISSSSGFSMGLASGFSGMSNNSPEWGYLNVVNDETRSAIRVNDRNDGSHVDETNIGTPEDSKIDGNAVEDNKDAKIIGNSDNGDETSNKLNNSIANDSISGSLPSRCTSSEVQRAFDDLTGWPEVEVDKSEYSGTFSNNGIPNSFVNSEPSDNNVDRSISSSKREVKEVQRRSLTSSPPPTLSRIEEEQTPNSTAVSSDSDGKLIFEKSDENARSSQKTRKNRLVIDHEFLQHHHHPLDDVVSVVSYYDDPSIAMLSSLGTNESSLDTKQQQQHQKQQYLYQNEYLRQSTLSSVDSRGSRGSGESSSWDKLHRNGNYSDLAKRHTQPIKSTERPDQKLHHDPPGAYFVDEILYRGSGSGSFGLGQSKSADPEEEGVDDSDDEGNYAKKVRMRPDPSPLGNRPIRRQMEPQPMQLQPQASEEETQFIMQPQAQHYQHHPLHPRYRKSEESSGYGQQQQQQQLLGQHQRARYAPQHQGQQKLYHPVHQQHQPPHQNVQQGSQIFSQEYSSYDKYDQHRQDYVDHDDDYNIALYDDKYATPDEHLNDLPEQRHPSLVIRRPPTQNVTDIESYEASQFKDSAKQTVMESPMPQSGWKRSSRPSTIHMNRLEPNYGDERIQAHVSRDEQFNADGGHPDGGYDPTRIIEDSEHEDVDEDDEFHLGDIEFIASQEDHNADSIEDLTGEEMYSEGGRGQQVLQDDTNDTNNSSGVDDDETATNTLDTADLVAEVRRVWRHVQKYEQKKQRKKQASKEKKRTYRTQDSRGNQAGQWNDHSSGREERTSRRAIPGSNEKEDIMKEHYRKEEAYGDNSYCNQGEDESPEMYPNQETYSNEEIMKFYLENGMSVPSANDSSPEYRHGHEVDRANTEYTERMNQVRHTSSDSRHATRGRSFNSPVRGPLDKHIRSTSLHSRTYESPAVSAGMDSELGSEYVVASSKASTEKDVEFLNEGVESFYENEGPSGLPHQHIHGTRVVHNYYTEHHSGRSSNQTHQMQQHHPRTAFEPNSVVKSGSTNSVGKTFRATSAINEEVDSNMPDKNTTSNIGTSASSETSIGPQSSTAPSRLKVQMAHKYLAQYSRSAKATKPRNDDDKRQNFYNDTVNSNDGSGYVSMNEIHSQQIQQQQQQTQRHHRTVSGLHARAGKAIKERRKQSL